MPRKAKPETTCIKPPRPRKKKKPRPEPKSTPAQRAKAKADRLRIIFNIVPEEDEKIKEFQGRKCRITGQSEKDTPLYLDHRHVDGFLRGYLSFKVNKGLALFNDDPVLLRAAADYLDNPPAEQALGEKVYGQIGKVTRLAGKKGRCYGPLGTRTPQARAVFEKGAKVAAIRSGSERARVI